MSTATAIRTVEQLVGYFPPKQQGQVRSMLSESLRGVVVQKLVPRKDGLGRVAAVEVLLVNRAVANLIRDDKALQIHSVMQTGASHGMRLLDESLAALVREGIITQEAARDAADDAARFGGVKT